VIYDGYFLTTQQELDKFQKTTYNSIEFETFLDELSLRDSFFKKES